jgi:ribonuclease P protein component
MIGKITIGKDFYGVLAYNEKKVDEGVGYVIDSNIEHSTPVNMTQEFNLIRELRPNLGKAVLHVSLNLPHSDSLNDRDFASIGNDYLDKMGFDNNQFIMYRHTDTEHEHIHIIVNSVKYSGRTVSDSNIKRRSREILNELEKKYGLTQIAGNKNAKKPLTQNEIEKTLKTRTSGQNRLGGFKCEGYQGVYQTNRRTTYIPKIQCKQDHRKGVGHIVQVSGSGV